MSEDPKKGADPKELTLPQRAAAAVLVVVLGVIFAPIGLVMRVFSALRHR